MSFSHHEIGEERVAPREPHTQSVPLPGGTHSLDVAPADIRRPEGSVRLLLVILIFVVVCFQVIGVIVFLRRTGIIPLDSRSFVAAAA